jgi:RHS repeat-associated protein
VYFDDVKVVLKKYVTTIIQADDYYPFGLRMAGNHYQDTSTLEVEHLYNGKELQDELGVDCYDYEARMYDMALGRWHIEDPAAETYSSHSPYVYVLNNPMSYVDPEGLEPTWPIIVPWDDEGRIQHWMWPDGTGDLIYPDGTRIRLNTPADSIYVNYNYTAELERRKREAYTDAMLGLAEGISTLGTVGVAVVGGVLVVSEVGLAGLVKAALGTETAIDIGNVGLATADVVRDPSIESGAGLGLAVADLASGPNPFGDFNTARVVNRGARGGGGGSSHSRGSWTRVSRWMSPEEAQMWSRRYSIPQPRPMAEGSPPRIWVTRFGEPKPRSNVGSVRVDFDVPTHALKVAGHKGWYQIFPNSQYIPIKEVRINY